MTCKDDDTLINVTLGFASAVPSLLPFQNARDTLQRLLYTNL